MEKSVQITKVCIMYPLSTATFALVLLISCNETTTMEVLYADIYTADVISYLQNKCEYKLDSTGRTIFVSKDSVYKMRMDLALIDLPKYDGKYPQIGVKFDTPAPLYYFLVEADLARSIETLNNVQQAMVVIKNSKARVIVKLPWDKNLSKWEAKGIQHLVSFIAFADEDIKENQIEILNAEGNLISNNFVRDFAQGIGTFTDSRDGKTYKTTKIGKQVWLAENLNYAAKGSKCGSVEAIVLTEENRKERARIYAENEKKGILIDFATHIYSLKDENTEYCGKYGRLYDWETAMTACPKGWHLPTYKEWEELINFNGGLAMLGTRLKAKSWDNGTDEFGFAALPSGYGWSNGHYEPGGSVHWWSSAEDKDADVHYLSVTYSYRTARWSKQESKRFNSVRCVENSTHSSPTTGETQ